MAAPCAHCGLPVGRFAEHREIDGVDHAFCCYGCCLAYQLCHHDAMLRSPARLDQRVRELNLGLSEPQPSQIWRVAEPPEQQPASREPAHQLVAQQNPGPMQP